MTTPALPCPFCGRQPRSRWNGAAGEDDDAGYWGIDCCQACAHEDSEAEAIAAWNKRALPSPVPAPCGDVEEALARVIFNDEHRGLQNCYDWDTAGLDDEHPGTRERYRGYAQSAIRVMAAASPSPAPDVAGVVTEATRLGSAQALKNVYPELAAILLKAATLITTLSADNARMREALEPFARQADSFDSYGTEFVPDSFEPAIVDHNIGDLRRARAALTPKDAK